MKGFGSLIILLIATTSCGDKNISTGSSYRTYRMGFNNSAPRFDDINLFVQSLTLWTSRADAAIISEGVPWQALLGGAKPADYITNNFKGLADYYRSKNLILWVYVDPQNGLERSSDAVELQTAGRSIAEPAIQQLYRKYVVALDSMLHPEHVGLALETNLIRAASPPAIYQGVKKAANDAAADLKVRNSKAKISVSVQVDHAWGKLVNGPYQGIGQDFTDFPFVEELGLSSYPYFGFSNPSEIPTNYYSRLIESNPIPVFASEGGWTSARVISGSSGFASSPEIQRDYIDRQKVLLDEVKAIAWFQLTFTDIDTSGIPPTVSSNIEYFVFLGMVDTNFQPKPALSSWDDIFFKLMLR